MAVRRLRFVVWKAPQSWHKRRRYVGYLLAEPLTHKTTYSNFAFEGILNVVLLQRQSEQGAHLRSHNHSTPTLLLFRYSKETAHDYDGPV